MKANHEDFMAYREEAARLHQYDPSFSVCMTGDNTATVAVSRLLLDGEPGQIATEWFTVERRNAAGYWRQAGKQLFGLYGSKGAAMTGKLPGRHVDTIDDLPVENV
jgi:hypothetical protein